MWQTVLIFLILGLVLGLILAYASKKFHVPTDPKLDEIIAALPGANCGACGFPGCSGCGTAIFEGRAPAGACPVGGAPTAKAIGELLGVTAEVSEVPLVARVKCNGTAATSKGLYEYQGANSCLLAKASFSGPKACDYGCFGLGTCAAACPFDAIEMVNGLPKVNRKKCTACGVCVKACPQFLNPSRLGRLARAGRFEEMVGYHATDCVECGSCSFACPSGIPIVQLIRVAKGALRERAAAAPPQGEAKK